MPGAADELNIKLQQHGRPGLREPRYLRKRKSGDRRSRAPIGAHGAGIRRAAKASAQRAARRAAYVSNAMESDAGRRAAIAFPGCVRQCRSNPCARACRGYNCVMQRIFLSVFLSAVAIAASCAGAADEIAWKLENEQQFSGRKKISAYRPYYEIQADQVGLPIIRRRRSSGIITRMSR